MEGTFVWIQGLIRPFGTLHSKRRVLGETPGYWRMSLWGKH